MSIVERYTAEVMGTVASVQIVGAATAPQQVAEAVEACTADLADLERIFSPFRPDSDISRLRRGACDLADADPLVAEVSEECVRWRERTRGAFRADWRGWFDPTGYVKGWAVERVARRHLQPLCTQRRVIAAGINVGGDLQVFTAPGESWRWRIGIADPRRAGHLAATLEIVDGAVATSGTAERGDHIVDPRTGESATSVCSASVVADSLTAADVWATAACVYGMDDLSWISHARTRSGIMMGAAGEVRRWSGAAEVVAWDGGPLAA
ncbi:FAD:protein FMN transferase [Microbacterium sp.]|uniref:FAD:protein FMN transferase n=1 Tax=Microbacterium sp. TaxID=51671 RepID=UPI003A881CE0